MTTSIQLDVKTFHKRIKILQEQWRDYQSSLKTFAAVSIVTGGANEFSTYQKSVAMHNWLLGYEFPETIVVLTPDKVGIVTSVKKGTMLEQLNTAFFENQTQVSIFKREKDGSNQEEVLASLLEFIDGDNVGVFVKDKLSTPLASAWADLLESSGKKTLDVAKEISISFSIKDKEGISNTKIAGKVTSMAMKDFCAEEIMAIVDDETSITHEKLSEKFSTLIDPSKKKWQNMRMPSDVSAEYLELCYPPIIQSGGNYNLKPSAASDNQKLHFGTIICSLGLRYKSFCSNIARTFLIEPTKEQEKNYKFLMELQSHIIGFMRPKVKLCDVYDEGIRYLESTRSDLQSNVTNNFGFSMGIEFRESEFILNSKNQHSLENGMVLNLSIGFKDLVNSEASDAKGKVYALLLCDTVRITEEGSVLYTDGCKQFDDISLFFKSEEDEEDEETEIEEKFTRPVSVPTTRKRASNNESNRDSNENDRKAHQRALGLERNEEMLALYSGGQGEAVAKKNEVVRKFESYKRDNFMPVECKQLKIVVDRRAETVIVPIYGLPVPFHILTIKNLTKSDKNEFSFLRINFNTPGRTFGKQSVQSFPEQHDMYQFVRTMTYRNADSQHINQVYREIMDLKKAIQAKENERKERADLVVQDNLEEIRGKRVPRLNDVFVRPSMDGKRVPGDLEIHANGLRYRNQLRSDQMIDILFSNIQHLIFQPCEGEMLVLLHFHLKNSIMVGKKKTQDVQFYREASEAIVEETGGRRRKTNFGDDDELAQEQDERRRRRALNNEFKEFSEKIQDSYSGLSVDVPFKELGFYGVPHRQSVLMQPTTDCLVSLSETPFFLVSIPDVEVAFLERVVFGLKNFDIKFIFKDHAKNPEAVNTVPMEYLQHVKDWLDSVDIVFVESNINYNWTQIMKTIRDDPIGFYEHGGWASMQPDNKDVDFSDSDEDQESTFEPDEEEEYSSSSEEDMEEVISEEEEFSESEEEDDGLEWDELEQETAREDARRDAKRAAKMPSMPNKRR